MTPLETENQIIQDALMYNGLNPGAGVPLLGALTWGGLDFAEYALSTDSGALAPYIPTGTSNGNTDAFINGVFTNALGRAPSPSDLTFYEHVVSSAPSATVGFAEIVLFVGISNESVNHNHGLSLGNI